MWISIILAVGSNEVVPPKGMYAQTMAKTRACTEKLISKHETIQLHSPPCWRRRRAMAAQTCARNPTQYKMKQ